MNASSASQGEKAMHMTPKVCVSEVVTSRYGITPGVSRGEQALGDRPQSWDQRREGIDVIRTLGGETIKLKSSPMQSTPKPGWIIVLTGGTEGEGYTWTLYGITRRH